MITWWFNRENFSPALHTTNKIPQKLLFVLFYFGKIFTQSFFFRFQSIFHQGTHFNEGAPLYSSFCGEIWVDSSVNLSKINMFSVGNLCVREVKVILGNFSFQVFINFKLRDWKFWVFCKWGRIFCESLLNGTSEIDEEEGMKGSEAPAGLLKALLHVFYAASFAVGIRRSWLIRFWP